MWVVMSAVVAGVVEETSFRGYLQRPIERRHGPVIAILVTGSVFGLAHFAHPDVGVVLLPFYIAVAAVYGALCLLHGFHIAWHRPPYRRQHVERFQPFYERSIRVATVARSQASHLGNGARCGVLGQCSGALNRQRFDGVGYDMLARATGKARTWSAG